MTAKEKKKKKPGVRVELPWDLPFHPEVLRGKSTRSPSAHSLRNSFRETQVLSYLSVLRGGLWFVRCRVDTGWGSSHRGRGIFLHYISWHFLSLFLSSQSPENFIFGILHAKNIFLLMPLLLDFHKKNY